MAEEQDQSQKTEEPTQKKLDDAARKGDLPQSQELKHWAMLSAGGLAALITGSVVVDTIRAETAGFLAHAHQIPVDGGGLVDVMRAAGGQVLLVLLLPFAILMLAGVLGNLVQHKPVLTAEKIKPKLNKISPLAGAKRMFSAQRVADFFKTLAKLAIVGTVLVLVLWPERGLLTALVSAPVEAMTAAIERLSLTALFAVVAAMTVIAALDFAFQRMQHIKKMRMTKQEVKDEHKQSEGDPHVRARLRQIRLERSKKRMMAAVPTADVVITNPTHFAVALKYEHGRMEVPVLVAKGVDAVAARIRGLAQEHRIPMVENPPLARALYAAVDIDEEIPAEHYHAVAEVISYVIGLARRRGRR